MRILLLAIVFLCQETQTCGENLMKHRGLYSGELDELEVTVPRKVSPDGVPIDGDLSHHHGRPPGTTRLRRALPEDTLHYRLNISGAEETLDLEPSQEFISPLLRVRRGGGSGKKTSCHYRGVVRHRRGSSVAISACNGLTGMLRLDSTEYWLEPSASAALSDQSGGRPHILFTRHRKRKKKKRKRKHEKNCGTREPPRLPASRLEWARSAKRARARGRRSVSSEHHVEALLVADASMVEFHHDGDVEMYLLTVMNIVSSLYQEPSIGNYINIVVVKIVLIEDDFVEGLNITTNTDHALKSFCQWQEQFNPSSEKDPHHHDIAVLVTRKDICAHANIPCSTLGVAHVGGMCQPDRSCNINEDNGITLAHTIAHEIGHNFGMYHDSTKSGCVSRKGSTMHVMTPTFEADSLNVAWSDCSRRDITQFLDQGLGSCLTDRPALQDSYSYPELPPGAMYNADYQCRLQFGPDSEACQSNDEICSRLWCTVDGMCTTNLYPAAPGTHCGKHMWCVNQTCVSVGEGGAPVAGGWGEWGEWSSCSRTCGAGVSIQERNCDHPSPHNGGSYCIGQRRRYIVCNTQPCPEGSFSFRALQCASFNSEPYFGQNFSWLPYFEPTEPCELYCTDAEDTIVASLGDSAKDGTPCNLGSRDMCIFGTCRKVGCDWEVDSDAHEDKCGICQGDGKQCTTEKGYYNVTHGEGYTEVALIPTEARNIRVEEIISSRNYIGVSSATDKTFYLNGKGEITIPGEYFIAGSPALYSRDKELENLRIPGPIKEDINIYVIFRDRNRGLYYEYTVPKERPAIAEEWRWELSDWSTCSATCGGGEQVSRAVCRGRRGEMTTPDKCVLSQRPSDRMRACNLHPCSVRWWIGPWQLCPVTCGELAMRKRSVICVSGSKELALQDSECVTAGQIRPPDQEPCPDVPPCLSSSLLATLLHSGGNFSKPPVSSAPRKRFRPKKFNEILSLKSSKRYNYDKWTIRPWTQCSVSCGVGFKKRSVVCSSQKCDLLSKPVSVKQCFRHCSKTNP